MIENFGDQHSAFFWLLPMLGSALSGLGSMVGTGAAAGSAAAGLGSTLGTLGSTLGGAGAAGGAGGALGGAGAVGGSGMMGMLGPLLKGIGGEGGQQGMTAPQVDMAHAQPKQTAIPSIEALAEKRRTQKLGL